MSPSDKKNKDVAPLDKYGGSIATVLGVGAAIWAFFRVGFTIRDGVERLKKGKKKS